MKAYYDISCGKNSFFRLFFPWVKKRELIWHRDKLDRDVSVIFGGRWMFQFDNKLPFILKGNIKIKNGIYHRIIKGKGLLVLKIKE